MVGTSRSPLLSILHFNDCYNIHQHADEPAGGAARFKTAIQSHIMDSTIVLFSGDIMSPSFVSTFTKGDHMIPVLNQCSVSCAVFGNHEFDFGLHHLTKWTARTSFPWLISNVTESGTNTPVAGGKKYHVIQKGSMRIGLIGLVEEECLSAVSSRDRNDLIYSDYLARAAELVAYLKEEEKADFVIALTHMRWHNDCKLADTVTDIDLILGGHDHDYEVINKSGKLIVKSGSDFRTFSKIEILSSAHHSRATCYEMAVKKIEVTSAFLEDPELQGCLNGFSELIDLRMDERLATFSSDLDCRFKVVRTQESAFGNLVTDVIRSVLNADAAIINSGGFRSDCIHPTSRAFTLRDLTLAIPMLTELCVLIVTGEQLRQVLENGVSQFPALDGRFPQVSGISFAFDPKQSPFRRVSSCDIRVASESLNMTRKYTLVVKKFQADGGDGYTILKQCPVLMSSENCPNLNNCIIRYLEQNCGNVIDVSIQGRVVQLSTSGIRNIE